MVIETIGVALTLFITGVLGIIFNRKNIIIILISIELMLLAININLIVYSIILDDNMGQILAIWILTVAAAESAIGLSLLVAYYRVRGSIGVFNINLLRG